MPDRLFLSRGDITIMKVDAIVNAANSTLMGGGGVDGAIHRAGGPEILEECKRIVAKYGPCKTGDAVITSAGRLPASYVIHTVGPVWHLGTRNESELLSSCYINSLQLAVDYKLSSIAFPNIGTGIYGYPKEEAAAIAINTVKNFLRTVDEVLEEVHFVCFDEHNHRIYESLISKK